MTVGLLVLAAALLLLSALIVAAETAAFQVSASRLRTLQEEGFKGAEALVLQRSEPGRVRVGVRLATRMLNLLAVGTAVGMEEANRGGNIEQLARSLSDVAGIVVVSVPGSRWVVSCSSVRVSMVGMVIS